MNTVSEKMEEDSLLQLKGDGGSTSIQLGVFIPKLPQTVNTGKKAKNQNTKSTSGALLEPHGDQGDGPSIKSRKREESVSYDDDDELVNGRDLPARTKRHKEVAFEEVSPTEREGAKQVVVSQKKQKRKRQHKGKKIQNAGSLEGRAKTAVEGVSALDYLHKWNSGITSWTFRKKTQYWLLKNMCDKSQVMLTCSL